jgi:hypothetical protein
LILMALAQGFAIGHDICKEEHFDKMIQCGIMLLSVMLDTAADSQNFKCTCCGNASHSIN